MAELKLLSFIFYKKEYGNGISRHNEYPKQSCRDWEDTRIRESKGFIEVSSRLQDTCPDVWVYAYMGYTRVLTEAR